jgi:PAS domain S-box-containing protein
MTKTIFHSLAAKIGTIVILIEIVVLSIMGGFYINRFNKEIDRRVEERVRVPGSLMAEGSLSYSLVANRQWMERLVGEELVEGMVLNIAQRVFYTLNPEKMGMKASDVPGLNPAWFTKEVTEPFVEHIIDGQHNYIISVTPIFAMDGRTPFLFVYLKMNTTYAEAEKAAILRLFLFGSLAAVLATSLAIFLIFRFSIFTRIQSILLLFKRVEEGDLAARMAGRIVPDEIGTLQEGVNSMIAKLQTTILSLQQSQKSVRRNERMLRRIIDSVPSMIFAKNAQGRFIIANQAVADSYGMTVEELTGKLHQEIHPDPEQVKQMLADDRQAIETGRALLITEEPYQYHTGAIRWLETIKVPCDAREFGEPAIVGLATDITKRRAVEAALRITQFSFDKAAIGIFRIDANARIIDVNDQAARSLGYTREELGTLSIFDIDPLVNTENWGGIWQRLLEMEGFDVFETVHRRKDGHEFPVEITSNLLEYGGQQFAVTFVQDITERKRSARALEASEQRYRNLFNEAPVMYVITDNRPEEPYIKDVNNMFLDILGYRREDVLDAPLVRYYTEDSKRRVLAEGGYQRAMSGAFMLEERDLQTRTGRIVNTLLHSLPEYDVDGRVIGTRAMFLDITERKIAEQEAKQLEAQLLQAQKMEAIGTLAGGIAHDFNNILSAVIGYSELSLYDVTKDSPVHRNLQQIYTAGLRARALVQQILMFSRKDERELRLLPPAPLVKEALNLLRSTLPATIEICQRFGSGIYPILADPTQIHQIVMNLCTNAAHAMEPEGGRLDVMLTQVRLSERDTQLHPGLEPGDYLKISIQDTGRGISPEIMSKIYDPYFSTKDKDKGTGLGLAVVHGIVQSYGGAISAYSEMNCGTTFNIYIPSQRDQIADERQEEPGLPRGSEHVLLVDDEPTLVDVGQQMLERLGYRVSIASGSMAALKIFRNAPHAIDLVITDMTMPKMTGDKLAVELLTIRPELPIILCTGYSINISAEKALTMGIKAFLYKPIVEVDLARVVRKVLDER